MFARHLREIRESRLLSKAEVARMANLSPLTVDRVEKGHPCRTETKRKILLALGFDLTDRKVMFPED